MAERTLLHCYGNERDVTRQPHRCVVYGGCVLRALLIDFSRFDSEFEPRVFHTSRQRKHSCPDPISGESSSGDEGVNQQCPSKKRDVSSDEESITDETAYRKKYYFIKRIAKSIIFVSSGNLATHGPLNKELFALVKVHTI